MTYLEELESMIVKIHGSAAVHVQTIPVEEIYLGKVVWGGDVELFELADHPRAERCYAWGFPSELGVLEMSVILEFQPVNSAEMAVRVALAVGARRGRADE